MKTKGEAEERNLSIYTYQSDNKKSENESQNCSDKRRFVMKLKHIYLEGGERHVNVG